MLYIVSTPIGNLKDITYRAVETLQTVDLIAAEDTRHTRILTQHYQITTPVVSYYEQNKFKKSQVLLEKMKSGQSVALVTDAGTPGISDPGYLLIRLAMRNGVAVTAVPGAAALIAALSVSGQPPDRFAFEGFLPVKTAGRKKKLSALSGADATLIFYESPHRLVKSLSDMAEVWDDPEVVCARELTKKFEEVLTMPASQLAAHFTRKKPKGEFVLLVNFKSGADGRALDNSGD